MRTIDSENAKQIRQPMDVYIALDARDNIGLTYDTQSDYKVLDDETPLSDVEYSMRKLADLQGDGFPLDGSCVLYNETDDWHPYTAGKTGLRGNIGETVTVRVTASSTIETLSIVVTGTDKIECNGTFYSAGASNMIDVNAVSATLVFYPEHSDRRVEIASITAGIYICATNENLVSCVVSLRSDLSLIDQTLPESEVNIEIAWDENISDILTNIDNETPLTYRAGYDNDLSDVRLFYVSEDVLWHDNILEIHAVDAVHKIDVDQPFALWCSYGSELMESMLLLMGARGIDFVSFGWTNIIGNWQTHGLLLEKGFNLRDMVAWMNNMLHTGQNLWANIFLWPTYVDAGRPVFSTDIPKPKWKISESDCGDVLNNVERPISKITLNSNYFIDGPWEERSANDGQKLGTASWIKNVGISLDFDTVASDYVVGFFLGNVADNDVAEKWMDKYTTVYYTWNTLEIAPVKKNGDIFSQIWVDDAPHLSGYIYDTSEFESHLTGGLKPQVNDLTQDALNICVDLDTTSEYYDANADLYAQFIPWNAKYKSGWSQNFPSITTMAGVWNRCVAAGIIASDATSVDLDIYGCGVTTEGRTTTHIGSRTKGQSIDLDSKVIGTIQNTEKGYESIIYPDEAMKSIANRSNKTGSFTWKGDPRMQPRDVFEYERLDGSVEICTLENITLMHEGGGTSAEITYRKGIC